MSVVYAPKLGSFEFKLDPSQRISSLDQQVVAISHRVFEVDSSKFFHGFDYYYCFDCERSLT